MQQFSLMDEDVVWAAVVARLGGAEALKQSAHEYGALRRRRGVKSAEDLLRLLLAYGPGGRSLRLTAAEAAVRGVSTISDVALMKRFAQCGAWLMALATGLLPRASLARTSLAKVADARSAEGSRPVRLVDGSRIEGPGDSCWRLHLCWDAGQRRIADLAVTSLAEGERLDRLPLQAGEIRLADAGMPDATSLRRAREAAADVLVRLTWNSLRLTDEAGRPLDWLALCRASHTAGGLDLAVRVTRPRGRFEPLPMRLVIQPKPPEVLDEARRRARRAATKGAANPRSPHPRLRRAPDPHHHRSTAVPSRPTGLCELYRVRWQIELAFKRLKSILRLDRLPAKTPDLARAWIATHLLLALLIEDTAAELADAFP
jgi:hypothetical protein